SLLPLIKKGIPVSLNKFDKGINLTGVPLTTPSPERVKRGNEAIISYFEELDRQGTETLFEAKMLLIGEGGAGKTTLVRKLMDLKSPMPEEAESTRGIDIHQKIFPAKDHGKVFTMHMWDFGGQEIYHATHQFFLTKRSLYILVIDNRKEENYDYWLQVQKLYGENSPLIVVQNEKGGRTKELPLNEMRELFPNIRIKTFAFDFRLEKESDKATLKSLNTFIEETIQTLPHIGQKLPRQWAEIRKAIVTLAKDQPLISREQYYSLCAEHGIPEEERALNLSEDLHDFGAFLHFQDDVLLAQTLFLQNGWVTNGVYALIDGLNNRENEAKWLFDEHAASRIWGDDSNSNYKNKVAELIALVEKFELCYEVSKKQYLIPQLLPGTRPMQVVDQLFKRTRSLQLRYQYGFMPKGLLSRLMVRLHRFIKTQDAIWNNGMLLYHPTYQSWAEIVETYGEREIRIWVKGGSVREFATLITDEINLLNETYGKTLAVKRFLPCVCHICRKSESPYFYDRSALELRRERGKATIECPNSYEDVNVQQIIEHVFVTPKSENPLKVFISYSKSDEIHKKALLTHLEPLQRNEHLITWDDTRILPGEDWNARIRQEISSADIVLALLSPDALATDYIWGHEIEKAVEQSASGKSTVIPVIVRPCDWGSSPLGRLSGLPRKAKPITSFVNTDEAWQEVIEGIREVVKQIKAWR
ncbi:MAG: TIR domain-containing protein, partial [Saprospiraceae bacterium]|nr:TIR domain-containing protein [Saprospiraceae bacterium]